MSILNNLFGRILASGAAIKEKLSAVMGVPLLGLDALSSTGYGPEAALSILLPLGGMGFYHRGHAKPYWYEYLLHNVHAEGLRALLLMDQDSDIIVIHSPWYLHDT